MALIPMRFLCGCLAAATAASSAFAQYPADFAWRATTIRGDNFQSHNQKVVWTPNGLFCSGQTQDGATREIIGRSTDGGSTWATILDLGFDNRPATLETDGSGNVYAIFPDSGGTRFVKFSASNNYASPVVSRLHNQASSAAKFASCYDPVRQRLYHATQWGYVFTFDRDGNLVSGQQVFANSGNSRPSYPHLFVDEAGIIHFAMTTADTNNDIPYETIRYLKSLDGGQSWRAMNGAGVSIPTTCAPGGPSTMINLPGEENYQTWLAAMHVKNGKAHFAYQTRNPVNPGAVGNPPSIASHVHYMRFDVATGAREIDTSPNGEGWSGDTLRVNDYSASFASDPADPDGPLYAAGKDGGRLNALISVDNGVSWHDYARSASFGLIANPGFYRQPTPEGKLIGSVATSDPSWATVNYFELPHVGAPPFVEAGADQTAAIPRRTVRLGGEVTENSGLPLSVSWSKSSGPGSVLFQPADSAAAAATFSQPGTYVLRLTADNGVVQASDVMRVVVGFVGPGSPMRILVPSAEVPGWREPGFDALGWQPALPGVGYETDDGSYRALIATDVETEMSGARTSIYLRAPFWLPDGFAAPPTLALRMKYDDGFVAYLNGTEIARANAPAFPAWSSEATAAHSDTAAVEFAEFDVSAFAGQLQAGANVLAIHGLNAGTASSDLLIVPELVPGGSFGAESPAPGVTLLPEGAAARALIPANAAVASGWHLPLFDDSGWAAGSTAAGYETGAGDYSALIGLDVEAAMYQQSGSLLVRVPFEVGNPGGLATLALRMKYDDGFVAFLNGFEVARANAPQALACDSLATANHPDNDAIVAEQFDLTPFRNALVAGSNLLAIHGLNQAIDSSDLLVLPELIATGDPGAASAFATWIALFDLEGDDALPDADGDRDGRTNFGEFAFGGDPTRAETGVYRPDAVLGETDGERVLRLTYRRPLDWQARGLSYQVETSPALGGWKPAPFTEITTSPAGDGTTEFATVEIAAPPPGDFFARIVAAGG